MKSPELRAATASEPLSLEEEYEMQEKWALDEDKLTFIILAREDGTDAHAGKMVGDVNLFLSEYEAERGAECEVMLAEPDYRRRGIAREALVCIIRYAAGQLPVPLVFFARVGRTNAPSLALFASLGFETVKVVEVFDEVELRLMSIDMLPVSPYTLEVFPSAEALTR